jgi:putative transposase
MLLRPRRMFELDGAAIDAIRLALSQNQPLGNERFYAKIEKMTGIRRQARPRGRPRLEDDADAAALEGQREPGL